MPTAMLDKLHEVQRRQSRTSLKTGLFFGAAILIMAMLMAMAIDGWVVLYEQSARWTLTLLALVCAAAGFVIAGLVPLLRERSMASVARQIDQAHPSLQERFLSLTELSQSKDSPEVRGSESMIRKVAEQADQLSGAVTAETVVCLTGLARARNCLAIAAGILALVFVLDFSKAKILCERFWAPGANITLTQVSLKPGDMVIGKGEPVTFEITTAGKITDSASILFRYAGGQRDTVSLKRTGTNSSFAYTKSGVGEPFEYSARAGDAQTAWHKLTLAERPNLSQLKLKITAPAYSHLPDIEKDQLPPQLRVLAGSVLHASFQSDQPLSSMTLRFSDGSAQALIKSTENTYPFDALLTNSFTFTPLLTNLHHLENLAKPSCEIVVYQDEAPAVKITSPNEEITARPDDVVKIDFEAKDDFGIASAKLVVTVKTETNTSSVIIPIPLKPEEAGAKRVHKEIDLDLAQFHLKQDQELSYVVQVTDTKQNLSSGAPEASQETSQNNSASESAQKSSEKTGNQAQNNGGSATNNALASAAQTNSTKLRPDPQKHLAMATKPQESNSRPGGSQPPPNDMVKRVLDAGQCSSCQPMRILVDEWGRSFEGQMREKLEIAIDPVLKLLDELLEKALELTDATLTAGKSAEGLSQKQSPAMEDARNRLWQADSAVTELNVKTKDTAYAFIGLQLYDIREAHISPAREALGAVSLETARNKEDVAYLEKGSFEIVRAREKLAALTRNYASVKRDYKLADAMQRLKKMHQIFLEDSQEMLGSKKPVLNPQERKVAEVDDEYVEKLRKLLEKKKAIMAELARILADDPRMLRRFMAAQQLEGTSLRDQMTLLAQRQKLLTENVTRWNGADEKQRAEVARQFLAAQGIEQGEIAERAAKMQENMLTWLPLDASDTDLVRDCRNLSTEVARLATEAASKARPETNAASLEAAHAALEKLRLLDGRLLQLEWSEGMSASRLKLYAANRMTEVANLITSQSGWIKKVETLNAGDFPQAVEVDQHRLTLDTTTLSEKLDAILVQIKGLSEKIATQADDLNGTVHKQILPEQSDATEALSKKAVAQAMGHQAGATTAFATGEKQFDELLRLIIAKIDEAPAPTDPGEAMSLEEMLAMLKEEQKVAEGLGIPCRPINVSVQKDWMKSGSSSGQGRAQARAAQAQARRAAEKAQQVGERITKTAQKRASDLAAAQTGPKRPSRSWNTIVSQLGEDLRQGRDNIPPEQYRQAIEQYFNTISEKIPAGAVK